MSDQKSFYNCHSHFFSEKDVPNDFHNGIMWLYRQDFKPDEIKEIINKIIEKYEKEQDFSKKAKYIEKEVSNQLQSYLTDQNIREIDRILKPRKLIDESIDIKQEKAEQKRRVSATKGILRRYLEYLIIQKISPYKRFTKLIQHYKLGKKDQILPNTIENLKIIALSMDMTHMNAGELHRPYEDQLTELIDLKKKIDQKNNRRKIKIELIPFIHLDPRHDKERLNIKKFHNKGFQGVKLYPPLGYFPWHNNLKPVFRYCNDEGLPVMVHTQVSMVFSRAEPWNLYESIMNQINTFQNTYSNQGDFMNQYFKPIIKENYDYLLTQYNPAYWSGDELEDENLVSKYQYYSNMYLTGIFTHPYNWYPILSEFPKLKICFAHMGGYDAILNYCDQNFKSILNCPLYVNQDWIKSIIFLMNKFRNRVYGDISGGWEHRARTLKKYLPKMMKKHGNLLEDRLLYGPDYYMSVRRFSESQFYKKFRKAIKKSNRPLMLQKFTEANPENFLFKDLAHSKNLKTIH